MAGTGPFGATGVRTAGDVEWPSVGLATGLRVRTGEGVDKPRGDTGLVVVHCCLGGDRLCVRLLLATGVQKESTPNGLDNPAYVAVAIHARTLEADAGPANAFRGALSHALSGSRALQIPGAIPEWHAPYSSMGVRSSIQRPAWTVAFPWNAVSSPPICGVM